MTDNIGPTNVGNNKPPDPLTRNTDPSAPFSDTSALSHNKNDPNRILTDDDMPLYDIAPASNNAPDCTKTNDANDTPNLHSDKDIYMDPTDDGTTG